MDVSSGWRGFSEVNRVLYDPEEVTVEQMEGWLKESGTYVRTIPSENADRGSGNKQHTTAGEMR